MKNHFLKSIKGSVGLETAIMLLVAFPAIYFMITFFGFAYIYTGKIIETTRSLTDYIAKSDGWFLDETTGLLDSRLPYAVSRYGQMLGVTTSAVPETPIYNRAKYDYKIYAAYITSGNLYICATVTSNSTPSTGNLPSTPPRLDTKTLSLDGPVWIVQAGFTIRGVSYTHMAVRKPTSLYLNLSQYGNSYTCSPSMTPITYP